MKLWIDGANPSRNLKNRMDGINKLLSECGFYEYFENGLFGIVCPVWAAWNIGQRWLLNQASPE